MKKEIEIGKAIYHSDITNEDLEIDYRGKDQNGNAIIFFKSGLQVSVPIQNIKRLDS